MIKILGIVCLFLGFLGITIDKIKMEKEKIGTCEEIRSLAEYLLREIEYSHIPIPDICKEYQERNEGKIQTFLERVCMKFENEEGASFEKIWEKEVENLNIVKETKRQLIKLGKCFGFSNMGHQISAIERFLWEIDKTILHNEKKFQDNKKLILYFGVMSGLLLSIILL